MAISTDAVKRWSGGFVIDASACLPWCCRDEANPTSEQLFDLASNLVPLHVPTIWAWEITNVVSVVARRGRITPADGRLFLEKLTEFEILVANGPNLADLPALGDLAEKYRLTAYDAAYLDLALKLSLPLATFDEQLKKAAVAAGVEVS